MKRGRPAAPARFGAVGEPEAYGFANGISSSDSISVLDHEPGGYATGLGVMAFATISTRLA
jgi:hypothetical protein